MDSIGTKLSQKPTDFKWVRDLYHHEGLPLVSLYRNEQCNFIFYWCDCNDNSDRWMAFQVQGKTYQKALSGLITLREFLLSSIEDSYVFLFDKTNTGEEAYFIALQKEIPENYLPDPMVKLDVNVPEAFIFSDETDRLTNVIHLQFADYISDDVVFESQTRAQQ